VYHHFKNKEQLFEDVLEYYISSVVQPRLQEFLFVETGSGKKNIRRVFDSVVELPEEYRWVGCLMTNSSVEIQQQPQVKSRIQGVFELFETGFLHQLNRIPEIQQKPLKYRKQLARNLLVAMEGFFVLVRLNNDTKQLRQYVDSALFVLNTK
jgi:AcrR family transcriptional regulator